MAEVNVILTDHGDHGVGVSSPQIPGLIAGVPSLADATATYLLRLLREAKEDVDGFVVHVERIAQFGERMFVVRCRQDYGTTLRGQIADALLRELHVTSEFRDQWPLNSFGDVTLAAALGSDRVSDVADAEADGEPVIAVFPYGDAFKAVGIQSPTPAERSLTLSEYVAQLVGDSTANAGVRELSLA